MVGGQCLCLTFQHFIGGGEGLGRIHTHVTASTLCPTFQHLILLMRYWRHFLSHPRSPSLPLPRVCHHLHTTHTYTPCSAGQIKNALNNGSKFYSRCHIHSITAPTGYMYIHSIPHSSWYLMGWVGVCYTSRI